MSCSILEGADVRLSLLWNCWKCLVTEFQHQLGVRCGSPVRVSAWCRSILRVGAVAGGHFGLPISEHTQERCQLSCIVTAGFSRSPPSLEALTCPRSKHRSEQHVHGGLGLCPRPAHAPASVSLQEAEDSELQSPKPNPIREPGLSPVPLGRRCPSFWLPSTTDSVMGPDGTSVHPGVHYPGEAKGGPALSWIKSLQAGESFRLRDLSAKAALCRGSHPPALLILTAVRSSLVSGNERGPRACPC